MEKSELWVYKSKSVDEQQKVVNSVNSSKNKSQVKKPSNFMVNGSSIKEEDENATDERHPSPEAEDEAIGKIREILFTFLKNIQKNQTEQYQGNLGQASSIASIRVAKTPSSSVISRHIIRIVKTSIHLDFFLEIFSLVFHQFIKIVPTFIK